MSRDVRNMNIKTRDFGEITIEEDDIVTFVQPIYGFENLRKFVFLFKSECSQFVWLQSVEDKDICFILVDSSVVSCDYKPILTDKQKAQLEDGEIIYWLMAVINDDFSKSTVNLKSPIILNVEKRKAMQVILEQKYNIKYPLISSRKDDI